MFLSLRMTILALTPVVRFHLLFVMSRPFSSTMVNWAVFGPESPWLRASISILLIPSFRSSSTSL